MLTTARKKKHLNILTELEDIFSHKNIRAEKPRYELLPGCVALSSNLLVKFVVSRQYFFQKFLTAQ